ncbi:hypothetical protein ACHAWF_001619, partial [Thalassiosira exigua]
NRSEDEEHTHLLQKMSEAGIITGDDLREYKNLSQQDRDFEFETILTTGNNERHKFNNIQARHWAVRHSTNAVRWKLQRRSSQIPFHVFHKPRITTTSQKLFDSATPEGVVTLQEPPDMINVKLFPDFPDADDKARAKNKEKNHRAWNGGSITNDGTIVIPIRKCRSRELKCKISDVRCGGGLRYYQSKVSLVDYFPTKLGFSVTIHEAQGRTIPKVILCISENPLPFLRLKWEGLYVALSRVCHRDDIHLLVCFDDQMTMEYIGSLKKNKFIKSYFDGYIRQIEQSWNT